MVRKIRCATDVITRRARLKFTTVDWTADDLWPVLFRLYLSSFVFSSLLLLLFFPLSIPIWIRFRCYLLFVVVILIVPWSIRQVKVHTPLRLRARSHDTFLRLEKQKHQKKERKKEKRFLLLLFYFIIISFLLLLLHTSREVHVRVLDNPLEGLSHTDPHSLCLALPHRPRSVRRFPMTQ